MSDLTFNPVSSVQFGIINFVGCSSSTKTDKISGKNLEDLASETEKEYGFSIEEYFQVGHTSRDSDIEYEFQIAVVDKSIKDIKFVRLYEGLARFLVFKRYLYEKDREAVHEDHKDFFFMVPDVIRRSWGKQSIELEIEHTNGTKQNVILTWDKQKDKQKSEDDRSKREEMRPWKTP
jgi:hypothetical protein